MSTFRIGRTEHITLGNDGIDSKVDAFIRDLRSEPGDPLDLVTDALRDTLIYFAEADIEAEDSAAQERKDEEDAARAAIRELEDKLAEAESECKEVGTKFVRLQDRCQELLKENAALRLTARDGDPVNLDSILKDNPNIIRIDFGDNKTKAYNLFCQASQIDERDPHEAISLYKRALQLDPKLGTAWTNLGNCFHHLDRPAQALECFRKAIEVEPRQPEAHFNLATALLETDIPDEREVELQLKLAIDCDPKFADAYYTLGGVYLRRQEPKKAKTYLEKFLELDPKSPLADDAREILGRRL